MLPRASPAHAAPCLSKQGFGKAHLVRGRKPRSIHAAAPALRCFQRKQYAGLSLYRAAKSRNKLSYSIV